MRILIAHNCYQVKAGEDVVVEAEVSLLKSYHHSIDRLEADNQSIQGAIGKAKAAASVIYSFRNKQRLQEQIKRFRPDIVHVHNFFPLLSPALYDACSETKVPVVQTLHNYRIACPGAKFVKSVSVKRFL
jgi:hypothetical protein